MACVNDVHFTSTKSEQGLISGKFIIENFAFKNGLRLVIKSFI